MFIPCAIGYGQVIVIVLVVVLLFGGKKIPELMRGVGRGVKEFKDAVNKDYTAEDAKSGQESAPKKEAAPKKEEE